MVFKPIALLLMMVAAQSLYTSSFWAKHGIDVRDQVLE